MQAPSRASSKSSGTLKSRYDSDWEDIEDVENQPRPLSLDSSSSMRIGVSSPQRRRYMSKTSYIASPARKQYSVPPTPSKSRRAPRKSIAREEVIEDAVQGAVQGVSFTLRYGLHVFLTAIRLLRYPFGLLLCLWILALVIGRVSHTIRSTFAPLCLLPGLYGSRFCAVPQVAPVPPGVTGPPLWADYPKLIDAQSRSFEYLLDSSVGGAGLSLEIKKAEMATSDLVTLVRVSGLNARETLSDQLSEFVDDAKKTGRDLQRLSSKIGGAVDNIMAVNDYALHQIEAAHSKSPTIMSMYGLVPWAARKPTYDVVTRTFSEAMGVLTGSLERLVLEAEVNLANLEKLEERLSVLHGIVSREDVALSNAKADLLADLWTILGGNRDRLRNFDNHLSLLKNLGVYRKKALAHVVAALQTLKSLSSDMEDIRERVAAPDLLGSKIPIEVHMKSIRTGLERLKESRVRGKKLEEDTVRRVLGISS